MSTDFVEWFLTYATILEFTHIRQGDPPWPRKGHAMTKTLVKPQTATPAKSTGRRLPLMTPRHPRWLEFWWQLKGAEGVRLELGPARGEYRSHCAGGTDKRYARKILAAMGGVDIEGSLTYFEMHGGYCDCEILLNVDPLH